MAIFYSQYHAEPLPSSEQFEVLGGAYVCCWVQATSEKEAVELNLAAIKDNKWKVVAVEEECCEGDELCYSDDPQGKEFFAQAVTDGECYVYHQWPNEPQEGDDVH